MHKPLEEISYSHNGKLNPLFLYKLTHKLTSKEPAPQ
jgi:hypothetical protein